MRTGAQYLSALRDGREIYIDGRRVQDVTTHPAFSPVATSIAQLFDIAADPANGMQYTAPETGKPANRALSIPRSRDDLTARRRAIEVWAAHTHGWVGRGPDHVGSFLAAFAANPQCFATEPRDLSANVTRHYRRLLDESLYVAYAIIPPQVSRATSESGWDGDLLQAGVVDEREDGIIVRGSQMLATGGAVADEILVSCIKPLTADDTDFAISFLVPAATPGLKLYCRRPYAPAASSSYDYPLTTRYDETDAAVVLDDVFVPWDRVLVYKDVPGLEKQFFDTGAHVLGNWQAQIRFVQKLQFIAAVAHRIAHVNGVSRLAGVQEKLGGLASLVSLVESAVLAAEYSAEPDEQGMWRPGRRAVYGAMGLQSEIYPRVLTTLRDLSGGGVLQPPSSVEDLTSPLTQGDILHYAQSPAAPAEERIKLLRLVWDIVGSEFAGRHHQYEMFYAGSPFVVRGVWTYRNYGFEQPLAGLDAFLGSYGVADT